MDSCAASPDCFFSFVVSREGRVAPLVLTSALVASLLVLASDLVLLLRSDTIMLIKVAKCSIAASSLLLTSSLLELAPDWSGCALDASVFWLA